MLLAFIKNMHLMVIFRITLYCLPNKYVYKFPVIAANSLQVNTMEVLEIIISHPLISVQTNLNVASINSADYVWKFPKNI